jgi:pyrimidine-specific ribonucleoside hydrolase
MNVIVETDIGRDADDFFALCYLVSAGVGIRAITISPGDPDQVAVVKFFLKEVGLEDVPVGVGIMNRGKSSVGGIHTQLLKKYNFPLVDDHYHAYGPDLIKIVRSCYPFSCDFFIMGPLTSVGKYISNPPILDIKRATMQGGFIGYDVHGRKVPRLDKFEGLTTCSTFNLCGDMEGARSYINCAQIKERNFIGKNICHTIVYDRAIHNRVMETKPKNRAGELLREGMGMYLERHSGKKFHDPSAAVCMLHPEIATWVKGKLYEENGKWGTRLDPNGDNIAINIDVEKLWERIAEGT